MSKESAEIDVSVVEGDKIVVSEGKAKILFEKGQVFYNKVSSQSRDVTVAVLSVFQDVLVEEAKSGKKKKKGPKPAEVPRDQITEVPMRVLDALSASGLRALRYILEVPGIGSVMANDLDAKAVEAIKRNAEYNGELATAKLEANHGDASLVMHMHRNEFDVIDLDPYGTASPFLDAAVQAVTDGGMLVVTCTDMGVLAGSSSEVCYTKYGSYPVKAKYCHEMALRILLSCISSHAARYKRYIVPLLSLSMDFYVRVFVRVYVSPSEIKMCASKVGYVYQCVGCDAFATQRAGKVTIKGASTKFTAALAPTVDQQCAHCHSKNKMGGPLWLEPIHDVPFVLRTKTFLENNMEKFANSKRLLGVLTVAAEELADQPLYYDLHSLCHSVHCTALKMPVFRSALLTGGYKVSQTHCSPLGIKTDAPTDVVYDIMRCWVKNNPVKLASDSSPAAAILAKEPTFIADFALVEGAKLAAANAKFVPNPEDDWGPISKAGGTKRAGDDDTDVTNFKPSKKPRRIKPRPDDRKSRQVCRRWAATGECEFGVSCKYQHRDASEVPEIPFHKGTGPKKKPEAVAEAASEAQE